MTEDRLKAKQQESVTRATKLREKEISEQLSSPAQGDIPIGPGGLVAPEAPPSGIHRVTTTQGLPPEKPNPRPIDPSSLEISSMEGDTELWLDREWDKQREANLAHGIISTKDSEIYRRAIKRDIDGDIIPEEENLRRFDEVKNIMPRPAGWLPGSVRSVFPRLPSFVRKLMERAAKLKTDVDEEVRV